MNSSHPSLAASSAHTHLHSSLMIGKPCQFTLDEYLTLHIQCLSSFRWAGKLRFFSSKCTPESLFFLLFPPSPLPFHFNLQFLRSFSSQCKHRWLIRSWALPTMHVRRLRFTMSIKHIHTNKNKGFQFRKTWYNGRGLSNLTSKSTFA